MTGQIEKADFLDLDGYDDIATSDGRQRLMEDDDRVTGLQRLLRDAFVKAADQWSEFPSKEGGRRRLPAVAPAQRVG